MILYRCIKITSDIAEFYLGVPVSTPASSKPIFAAKASLNDILSLLKKLRVEHSVKSNTIVIYNEDGRRLDDAFMRAIVFAGLYSHVRSKFKLMDFVLRMNIYELVFWYSKFTHFFRRCNWS